MMVTVDKLKKEKIPNLYHLKGLHLAFVCGK